MKLFLISQTVNSGYDTYDSAVVVAKDEQSAKEVHPHETWIDLNSTWCPTPEQVTAVCIGTAIEGSIAGTIVCASFNAA